MKPWVFFCCLILVACGSSSSKNGDTSSSQSSSSQSSSSSVALDLEGEVYSDAITSAITGIRYPLNIYIPVVPPVGGDGTYETVYALDGQWSFEGYASIIEQSGRPLLLVSIHQGPTNRRNVDYILPGAFSYFNFLTQELIPYIEQTYPASAQGRALVGTSGGGMFVDAAMLMDDVVQPHFPRLLSMDAPTISPAYTRQRLLNLEQNRYNTSANLNVDLMLTGALAAADIGPFNDEVLEWYQFLLDRDYAGLNIIHRAYNVNHYQIVAPSFTDALPFFYGEN